MTAFNQTTLNAATDRIVVLCGLAVLRQIAHDDTFA